MKKRNFFFMAILFLLMAIVFMQKLWTIKEAPSSSEETKEALPTIEENVDESIAKTYIGKYELPINGATGYASISLNLFKSPDSTSTILKIINAGTGFTILDEHEAWWKVEINGQVGWVIHQFCFINLPDIIPSIIYNNTNTYQSEFVSSSIKIPNITGQKLYDGQTYNQRLNKAEFIVPVLYSMASKIQTAQSLALTNNESLIIYEGYRPYIVQEAIVTNLLELANSNAIVYNGIASAPWGVEWFVATDISNHQLGYAIDVSLAKIHSLSTLIVGPYSIKTVEDYELYTMPTNIHELSNASIVFTNPVNSKDKIAWSTLQLAPSINSSALKLQGFAVDAGLTPLASEWWHFNDLDSFEMVKEFPSTGNFYLEQIYSKPPK